MGNCLAVILAAGDSSRMNSSKSKVLHEVAGKPIISHIVDTTIDAKVDHVAIIVGRDAERVEQTALMSGGSISTHKQHTRNGTAKAVLCAREQIEKSFDHVLCLVGDIPLLSAHILTSLRQKLTDGADVVVAGFEAQDPYGYGRMIMKGDQLVAIVEDKETDDAQKKITFCNSGIIAIKGQLALTLIDQIDNDNLKGEYYLTDIVQIAQTKGLRTHTIVAPEKDLMGCNTRSELAEIEAEWQMRKREALMLSGVTMIAPETVFLSHDTDIAKDVTIEPHVVFGPGVVVEEGVTIHSFSHLEGAYVSKDAVIGPFARLRPGSKLSQQVKVGNFCEIKNAAIGAGSKVNHLSYIGDAKIGEKTNIGAGTITCNYDGFNKHLTHIGDHVFVGSNSLFVAPVQVGDYAMTATGTVVTGNVPSKALSIARVPQTNIDGKAMDINEKNKAAKDQSLKDKSLNQMSGKN